MKYNDESIFFLLYQIEIGTFLTSVLFTLYNI